MHPSSDMILLPHMPCILLLPGGGAGAHSRSYLCISAAGGHRKIGDVDVQHECLLACLTPSLVDANPGMLALKHTPVGSFMRAD